MQPIWTFRWLVAATLTVAVGAGTAGVVEQERPIRLVQADTELIWCHDASRSIVRRVYPWTCDGDGGQVVSAEQAEEIRQQRVKRIQRVLNRDKNPLVPGKRMKSTGTGFFISRSGDVLTNNHVVDECAALTVTPPGTDGLAATLVHRNPGQDLALLKVDRAVAAPARFRSSEAGPAESVTVVGYPLLGKVVIKPTLATGQVDDDVRTGHPQVFAMKIDVRRGNSGGPVLDDAGRVVGVVFAKVDTPKVYSRTGKVVRDVGLGLRLGVVRNFLRNLPAKALAAGQGDALGEKARLELARGFIVQVGCWG